MLGAVDPDFNIDDVHRDVLDELLGEEAIDAFSQRIAAPLRARWHELDAWPDFVPALARLRPHYLCVSFTILSLALVIDTSRRNGIVWDAVIPCEMLRVYKPRPEAYRLAAQISRRLTRRHSDGGLPQFRPRCGPRRRLPDRLRAAARRMGTGRSARPVAEPGSTSLSPALPNWPTPRRMSRDAEAATSPGVNRPNATP